MTNNIIPEIIDNQALKKNIYIKGARSNNLKDIDLLIPKNKLVVVTGLSGSGKSSLIMDTLYAEGQRRYVESLSSYARQFLSRMKKPDVDYIKGISPAIAIEQKVTSSNARSSVGSLTEINDYLRLLYARIGRTISPVSGEDVKKHEVSDVVDFIYGKQEGTKIALYIPMSSKYDRVLRQELDLLLQKGFTRIKWKGELQYIQDVSESDEKILDQKTSGLKEKMLILIDRFVVSPEEENRKRIADSVLTCFQESLGDCIIDVIGDEVVAFNNRFELDGIVFLEPSHQLFNYNNPYGACPECEGYGKVLGIDPDKVIPDGSKSFYEDVVAPWKGEKSRRWKEKFIDLSEVFDFPIHRPYDELSIRQKDLVWNGNKRIKGINDYFESLKAKSYKIQNRVLLARYRGKTDCPSCGGGRLRKEALYVKINGTPISELMTKPLDELLAFFDHMELSEHDSSIADRILYEVKNRLKVMTDVGLSYLNLDRESSTLSGGETQRINLTRILGSNLTNSMYILDEPSIGLHPKDTEKLIIVLKQLRDLGNTVIVVEHEEEVIKAADHIIDIGPLAGRYGGELVFSGDSKSFVKKGTKSITSEYLRGEKVLEVPKMRRKVVNKIKIVKAAQHNLKNIDVTIPLNVLSVLSGVSGSGKTSLVKHVLHPALSKSIGESISKAPGKYQEIIGDLSTIAQVELINQSPLGRSSRSNPVTYVKAYDAIRKLYSSQQLAKIRGYKPKHFSFNVEGGRCEVCKGDGEQIVEMQFLSDIKLECEECKGQKFKSDVLEIKYNDKNIYEVLEMSIEEAMEFFSGHKDIIGKIKPLYDVGLGYVKMGQSSSTLSGGEAQRVKLASYLNKESKSKGIFFIFDEPTTGLHFHDVVKLMDALNGLVENGHTVLVIEHNMDVIKSADWVIDLGPIGGKDGGFLLYEGQPEGLSKVKGSYTGQYLREKL